MEKGPITASFHVTELLLFSQEKVKHFSAFVCKKMTTYEKGKQSPASAYTDTHKIINGKENGWWSVSYAIRRRTGGVAGSLNPDHQLNGGDWH